MTEQDWLAMTDSQTMMWSVRSHVSDRKLQLFACACCRRIWRLLQEEGIRELVEASEKFADKEISEGELKAADEKATLADGDVTNWGRIAKRAGWPVAIATQAAFAATGDGQEGKGFNAFLEAASCAVLAVAREKSPGWEEEPAAQCELGRDIFGSWFRPVRLRRSWLTVTVSDVAQAIDEERAFDRLPILADALEDAGCTNADLLNHCRQPGVHARGCWAVDLVLGKK